MQQPTPDSVHCTGVPTVSRPFPCQLFICSVNLAPKLSVAHFGSVAMLYWWPEAQSAIFLCHCMYCLVCSTIYKTATKLPGASQFACCQSSRFLSALLLVLLLHMPGTVRKDAWKRCRINIELSSTAEESTWNCKGMQELFIAFSPPNYERES